MSLNNISLPAQLVADLYQHSLVGGSAKTVPPPPPPAPFLGNNGKNILIVVNQPEVRYLPEHELAFLTKVLTACQLGLLDVAIVNKANAQQHDAKSLLDQFNAKAVILFDLAPEQLGFSTTAPLYGVQKTGNLQLMAAPALTEIEKTKEAKNQLWLALKEIFGL